jgi:hypothetical protein
LLLLACVHFVAGVHMGVSGFCDITVGDWDSIQLESLGMIALLELFVFFALVV